MKEKKTSSRRQAIEDIANAMTMFGITTYDACLLGCMLLNVASKGSIASFETLGISFAESHFDLTSAKAGSIVASCGTLGVVVLLCMGQLSVWFTDVQLISGGLLVMGAGIASLASLQENVQNHTWRYFVAIFLIYSIGYPVGHTAVIGLFSKGKYQRNRRVDGPCGSYANNRCFVLGQVVAKREGSFLNCTFADSSPILTNMFVLSLSSLQSIP